MKAEMTEHGFYVHDQGGVRRDLNCENSCKHYRDGENCEPSKTPDTLVYPFCGRVCGYWQERDNP